MRSGVPKWEYPSISVVVWPAVQVMPLSNATNATWSVLKEKYLRFKPFRR